MATVRVIIPGRDSTSDLARWCESGRSYGTRDGHRPLTVKEWANFGKVRRPRPAPRYLPDPEADSPVPVGRTRTFLR
jgi:hypothetical protein